MINMVNDARTPSRRREDADDGMAARSLPRIPGFRMIELCGRGGAGAVYLAIDRDGVRRAVRVLNSGERFSGVRAYEDSAIARYRNLVHGNPHLIDILYAGRFHSTIYYVLPLADSASARQFRYTPLTLAEKLRQREWPLAEKLHMVRDIADAVLFLHARGIAHRDLKPENILFVDGVLKVADPGMLSPIWQLSTGGTREFSPPRPLSGCRTDIYSLGMIMYCVFTGFPPERFPDLTPEWNNEFYSRLNRIILRCCDTGRNAYRSMADVVADLQSLDPPAPRWSTLRAAWRRSRRSAELWLVLMALLFGFVSCHGSGKETAATRSAGIMVPGSAVPGRGADVSTGRPPAK